MLARAGRTKNAPAEGERWFIAASVLFSWPDPAHGATGARTDMTLDATNLIAQASSAGLLPALLAARVTRDGDAAGPLELAYLAASLLLPVRLAILTRAWAELPALAREVESAQEDGSSPLTPRVRRSTSPYAEVVRTLLAARARAADDVELEAARERALRKTGQRTLRSQALDAASLLLLLWLVAGRPSTQSSLVVWGVSWLALNLLATIFVRASLQHRLETAAIAFATRLGGARRADAGSSACAFCGAEVDTVELELRLPAGPIVTTGALCRACGKVVSSRPPSAPPGG